VEPKLDPLLSGGLGCVSECVYVCVCMYVFVYVNVRLHLVCACACMSDL